MKTKRFISLVVASLVLLMMFTTPAMATGELAFSIEADEIAVKGSTYEVVVNAVTTATISQGAVNVTFDPAVLEYSTGELNISGSVNLDTAGAAEGFVAISIYGNVNAFTGPMATLTFNVKADAAEGAATPVATAENTDGLLCDEGYNPFEGTTFGAAESLTVKPARTADPVVTVTISDAEPVIGDVLSAEVAIVDEWDLDSEDAVVTWKDGEGNALTAEADGTYKVKVEDLGKTIKAEVAGTVDAPIYNTVAGVSAETAAVAKNPEYKPTVSNIAFDKETVKVGTAVAVTYDYAYGNVIGDESDASVISFIKADAADAAAEDWAEAVLDTDYTVEDGKVKFTKEVKGMFIKISVLATDADEAVAEAATLSETAYEIKNKSTSGTGGLTGPNLANPTPSTPVTPVDPSEPTEPTEPAVDPIKDAPADKLVLVIGRTDVAAFGEVVANDVAPIIVADRTMLPARVVAEALGAEVAWDGEARVVTITKGDITIVITIDSDVALVNGEEVKLDSPAFIQNDRTYTPIRFVAEALGATVEWDAATQAVTIAPAATPAE